MIHMYFIENSCSDEKSIEIHIYLFSHEENLQVGEDYCNFSGSSKIRRRKSYKEESFRFFPYLPGFVFEIFALIIGFEFQKT